jgi:hypothetical protein
VDEEIAALDPRPQEGLFKVRHSERFVIPTEGRNLLFAGQLFHLGPPKSYCAYAVQRQPSVRMRGMSAPAAR